MKKYFVTSALPYANGDIHIGHLVEYIQTDIWVRLKKLLGNEVVYVCADDAHGTPVMLKAESEKTTPEKLIAKMQKRHKEDFDSFYIEFDNYYTTHSKENEDLSSKIFESLKKSDLIEKKIIEQFFDEEKQMFLPDRYIVGTCPRCGALDQYGDSCEKCGATYSPTDLSMPKSVLTGNVPVRKKTDHYFFKLSSKKCFDFLNEWIHGRDTLQEEARNKIREWLQKDEEGYSLLADWDISRDAPYFGFKIPGTENKYFYVWLDAPIGYYASLINWCSLQKKDANEYIGKEAKVELIHFIGKDILYFHALFWPAMLHFSGFRTPTSLYAHGFLTINGKKMSKSRGTFITARAYLKKNIEAEFLRYYFASKLNGSMEDLDMNMSEFVQKVNGDLVGKFINIQSRCSGFLLRHFDGEILSQKEIVDINPIDAKLEGEIEQASERIKEAYNLRNTSRAVKEIMQLVDQINNYIQEKKPWETAKNIENISKTEILSLHGVLSLALRCFGKISILLKPVIPITCNKIERDLFCRNTPFLWDDIFDLRIKKIRNIGHLIKRINEEDVINLVEVGE